MIKAEGLDSLTDDELRTACKARGLKAAYGEGAGSYMRKQMQVGATRLRLRCFMSCTAWRLKNGPQGRVTLGVCAAQAHGS